MQILRSNKITQKIIVSVSFINSFNSILWTEPKQKCWHFKSKCFQIEYCLCQYKYSIRPQPQKLCKFNILRPTQRKLMKLLLFAIKIGEWLVLDISIAKSQWPTDRTTERETKIPASSRSEMKLIYLNKNYVIYGGGARALPGNWLINRRWSWLDGCISILAHWPHASHGVRSAR